MKVEWSDNFEELYKQRGQQKHGIRLLALWKLQSGMTETEVCEFLSKTHKTLHLWRKRYESGGLEALLSIGKGRGRKARVSESGFLSKVIEKLEKSRDGGRIRCQDIVDYLKDKEQIEYSIPGMYHVLHRLGFSWITARSKHPHHKEEDIEAFKKKFQ